MSNTDLIPNKRLTVSLVCFISYFLFFQQEETGLRVQTSLPEHKRKSFENGTITCDTMLVAESLTQLYT